MGDTYPAHSECNKTDHTQESVDPEKHHIDEGPELVGIPDTEGIRIGSVKPVSVPHHLIHLAADCSGHGGILHCIEQIVHQRSEEHTSELQSRGHLVCRLLLEKKKLNMQLEKSKQYKLGR